MSRAQREERGHSMTDQPLDSTPENQPEETLKLATDAKDEQDRQFDEGTENPS